eukprot:11239188-Ditylum_brightwellii.AAC.1
MPETGAEVDADTIKLIPHTIPIPKYGDKEAILKHPGKSNIPSHLKGDDITQAFANVAKALG